MEGLGCRQWWKKRIYYHEEIKINIIDKLTLPISKYLWRPLGNLKHQTKLADSIPEYISLGWVGIIRKIDRGCVGEREWPVVKELNAVLGNNTWPTMADLWVRGYNTRKNRGLRKIKWKREWRRSKNQKHNRSWTLREKTTHSSLPLREVCQSSNDQYSVHHSDPQPPP